MFLQVSVHRGCTRPGQTLPKQTPPRQTPPYPAPGRWPLQRTLHILLECIVVSNIPMSLHYSLSRQRYSLEYFSTAYRSMNEWVARAQEEKLIKRKKHEELMQQKREEIRQVHVQI